MRSIGGYGNGCNQWKYARQFTIYNDMIYIADTYSHKIKKISITGQCNGFAINSRFSSPHAIAVNSNYIFVGYAGTYVTVMHT